MNCTCLSTWKCFMVWNIARAIWKRLFSRCPQCVLMQLSIIAVSGSRRKQENKVYLISFCEACCLCRSMLWSSLLMLACKLFCKKRLMNEMISSSRFIWRWIQTTQEKFDRSTPWQTKWKLHHALRVLVLRVRAVFRDYNCQFLYCFI